jgi:two-component system cell cycle sensor histidine kinase/response regulator CckA
MPIKSRVDEHLRQSSIDHAQATRFLSRVSWLIVIVLGTLAASMWIAPYASAAGYKSVVAAMRVGAFLEFFGLIGLVVILRRRFAVQVDRAAATYSVLATQNEHLAVQNQELLQSEGRQRVLADEASLLSRRLAEAQRVAQLGYWEIDSATGAVYWSDEMYRLAGLEKHPGPVPTDRFLDVVHPDDRERMQSVATEAVAQLTEFTEQYRIVLPSGGTRTVQSKGRVIVDAFGAKKLVGTVQDVSDRVHLEAQLRRAQKMDAVGQLAGGVAHDFNNVLTVIEGYSSLLLAGRRADDQDFASIEEIRGAARRAAGLTRQLLAFSRQQVLQPRLLNLNDAVNGVTKMLGRLIGEHIEFHTKLDPSLDHVRADPGQIEQVLMNLAVNARDAMVNGGVLTVETANVLLDSVYVSRNPGVSPGPYVMLAVTDTGTGIAPGDLERIFEPFFTTKEAGKGTGLGLSTVHGIVEQSGGHISVYSERARGTSFKVYLPRIEGGVSTNVGADEERKANLGHETILLVEDDAAVRTVAASILKRAGYGIIATENGVEALRVCQDTNSRFDLVLSDMVMPGLGGRALASHVSRIRPSTPVVLMSGYTRDAMMHSAELNEGTLFVEKPFTPEALTRKVREALDRRQN